MKPIKGYIPPKREEPRRDSTLAESMLGTAQLFENLKQTKADLVSKVDTKISEVNKIAEEAQYTVKESAKKIDDKVAEFEDTAVTLIKEIHSLPNIKGEKGEDGADGKDADEQKITEQILAKIPKVDENVLVKKVLKAIPESKASLKVIRETLNVEPKELAKQIMSLPEEQFIIRTSQVDGLDQTIRLLQHSSGGKGYVHGGGFNNIYSSSTLVSNGLTGLNFTGSGVSSVTKNTTTGIITVDITGGGGGTWGSITGTLSNQTDLQSALDAKQATLVSGTNIKTINGNSLLGSGDLVVGGGDVSKVGTPVNNQVGVWTGDGTLEGDAALTFDTETLSVVNISNVTGRNLTISTQNIGGAVDNDIFVITGNATAGDENGGELVFTAGEGFGTGFGGSLGFTAGIGGATGEGGLVSFIGGIGGGTSGKGGDVSFAGGAAQAGDSNGGDVILVGGTPFGSGTGGLLKLKDGDSTVYAILNTATLATSDKTFTFPDATGTLALTSDLSSYLPLTGGTLTGNLLFTDNTYDIGASGATRPRTGYFGTSLITPEVRGASASRIHLDTDSSITLTNSAGTNFSRLQLGGTTSSFPAIKRNGAGIRLRLADDSADADLIVRALTTTSNIDVGGTLALATNSLTLTGSIGATGARATKLWATDIESTNMPTVGGTSLSSVTATFTNKRITERVVTTTDDSTAVIDVDVTDQYQLTAMANATTISTTGTPTAGQKLVIRLKDNGTGRALTWDAVFRAIGVTLPTTTVANKTHYIGCIYNLTDTKWDAVSVASEA